MSTPHTPRPCWSTAAFGDVVETSPMELSLLGEHLQACRALCGRPFALVCAAEAARAFVASRVVTSLLAVALLAGVGLLAW